MKTYNELDKLVQTMDFTTDNTKIYNDTLFVLQNLGKIYSYIVYADRDKDGNVLRWQIQYDISQTDTYNTLPAEGVASRLSLILPLIHHCKSRVLTYEQPSIELMLKVYDPLIRNLVKKQCEAWTCLEYDDAYQMCQLVMLILYRKQYYIHKRLLEKAYNNYVLLQLRSQRGLTELVSLDDINHSNDTDEPLRYIDMLPDPDVEADNEAKEYKETMIMFYDYIKKILSEILTERQMDMLLSDYGHKHTTPTSRKQMTKVKQFLQTKNINWNTLYKELL